ALAAPHEAPLAGRADEPPPAAAVVNLSAESNLVLGDEAGGQPTLILDGERVDSLGRDPFFFGSPQEIESTSIRNVFEMSVSGLVAEGTYAEADGTRVALYDLLVTDRLSGARRRYELPVRLLDEGLYRGAPDLGTIEVTTVAGVPNVNSSPYASLDHALTQRGAAIEIDVLANDTDVDGDSFEVVAFTTPRHGTLEALGEGRFRYTPDEGFDGLDAFSYQVEDSSGSGRASGGRVRIDVIATASDSLPRVPRPGVDAGMRTDGGVVDAPDGGSDAGPGGGPGGRPGEDPTASSGGCQVTAGPTPGFGVLLLAWLMARRRR
ncbi:MAG: Ig-like domain-containing protein, partial [Myxococcota bacterium]